MSGISCTVFSIHQNENIFVGNNEDWYNPYPKYRIIPGVGNQYGRIIFSFENNWGLGGMNEKGLFYDWVMISDEPTAWEKNPLKKDFRGNLSDKILSECSSVEEALEYYKVYNEPGFKTSYIALVDTSGQTVFVSWEDDKLTIKSCKGRCVFGYGGEKVAEKFKEIEGSINKKQMSQFLNTAHQEGEYPTLYSNLFDLKKGLVYLYYFHDFEEELVLDLQEELKKGKHSVELKDVFKTQIPEEKFRQLQSQYLVKEMKSIPLNGWLVVLGFGSLILMGLCFLYFFTKKK